MAVVGRLLFNTMNYHIQKINKFSINPANLIMDVENLNAWYGSAQILFDINMHISAGEVVALMGRNGAGKSTTLRTLMGMMPRRSGRVTFLGNNIGELEPFQIARQGLGFVPEDRRIFTDLTVLENLNIARQPIRQFPNGVPAPFWSLEDIYALFPNLASASDRLASKMSGGEQQMLTIARTLMGNPIAILLDEPSEGIAPAVVEKIAEMMLKLKSKGVSIILSEQNIHFASWVCDRAYMLEKGQIQYTAPMKELIENKEVLNKYLGI